MIVKHSLAREGRVKVLALEVAFKIPEKALDWYFIL